MTTCTSFRSPPTTPSSPAWPEQQRLPTSPAGGPRPWTARFTSLDHPTAAATIPAAHDRVLRDAATAGSLPCARSASTPSTGANSRRNCPRPGLAGVARRFAYRWPDRVLGRVRRQWRCCRYGVALHDPAAPQFVLECTKTGQRVDLRQPMRSATALLLWLGLKVLPSSGTHDELLPDQSPAAAAITGPPFWR